MAISLGSSRTQISRLRVTNNPASNNSFNRSADWIAFIIVPAAYIECFMPRPVNSGVRLLLNAYDKNYRRD